MMTTKTKIKTFITYKDRFREKNIYKKTKHKKHTNLHRFFTYLNLTLILQINMTKS